MFNESVFETLESGDSNEWNEWNESGDSYDSSERFGRRGGRPGRNIPRPQQGNATAHTPQAGYATKAELEATANRLDGRIAVNTKAIDAVNGRVSSLGLAHNRLNASVKTEIADRKATTDALKQQVENMKMAVMLTPLISTPKTIDMTVEGKTVKILTDDGDMFRMILPMMMMNGGFGGSSSGATGSSSNDMMMPMMMIAMSQRPRT